MKISLFKNQWLVLAISLVLILGAGKTAQASEITDGLKSTIDRVISVVTDPQYDSDLSNRRNILRGIIFPQFNFLEMGKRSLGSKRWKALSSEERKAFIDAFGQLLENSFASKLETYEDEQINYLDEIIKGRFSMVKTEMVRKDGTTHIDYKLINSGGKWRVFDVTIEGVSMIKNYRSQFAKIIHRDSFGTLMDKLNTKIKILEDVENNKNTEDNDKI